MTGQPHADTGLACMPSQAKHTSPRARAKYAQRAAARTTACCRLPAHQNGLPSGVPDYSEGCL